ncbi:MAG: hypothetical protein WBD02_10650, partial [Acidimicrobiia bacterium]
MDLKSKLAAVGLSAGLLGGGTAGMLLSQASVAGAADSNAASSDANRPDPGARVKTVLDKLVKDGTLTQAQADKVLKALKAAMPQGGKGGPGRGGFGRGVARGVGLEAAAKALGMTAADLRTELQSGKTIAAVATEKKVDVNTVIDALVTEMKAHLDTEVKDGTITQAQADERMKNAKTRITDMVNNGPKAGQNGAPADAPAAAP